MFNKLKNVLLGEKSSEVLTRQELVNYIYKYFVARLDEETTDVGLLFHTSFYIYLNERDYSMREQSFAYTVQDVMKKINVKLKEMRKRYPEYRPHSEYWQFQFIAFKDGGIINNAIDDYVKDVEVKKPLILSFIHPDKIYQSNDDGRVVATVHVKDSVAVNKWAINKNALQEMDIAGKDRFRIAFKDDVRALIAPVSAKAPTGRAVLKVSQCAFLVDGIRESSITMNSDYLQISGKNDVNSRGGMAVAKLDSDEILNPHLIIRYEADRQRFALSAIGDVVLNEVSLPMDSNVWTPLANNSSILLNGEIQISFKVNK